MPILKHYDPLPPDFPKIPLDSWQQWQLEYFGNPIYAQNGIRLGTAFLETFYSKLPSARGELFTDIARLPDSVASVLIIDFLIDHTDKRAEGLAKISEEFRKGDPTETEGVIVTPRKDS